MDSTERNGGPAASVLGRAIGILSAFGQEDAVVPLSELARRTGLPKPTVHRILAELGRWNVVERVPQGYRPGLRLFELGHRAPQQRDLREAALPYLGDLLEATHETIHLGVLDGNEVVYLEKLSARAGPELGSRVGGRMPAHCTGIGKALLAFSPAEVVRDLLATELPRLTPRTVHAPGLLLRELATVRARGIAFEHEESSAGVVCAACPVFGPDGSAVAAISVAGWSYRLDPTRVGSAVRTAALALTRDLQDGSPLTRPGTARSGR